jgi:hypothetical protein
MIVKCRGNDASEHRLARPSSIAITRLQHAPSLRPHRHCHGARWYVLRFPSLHACRQDAPLTMPRPSRASTAARARRWVSRVLLSAAATAANTTYQTFVGSGLVRLQLWCPRRQPGQAGFSSAPSFGPQKQNTSPGHPSQRKKNHSAQRKTNHPTRSKRFRPAQHRPQAHRYSCHPPCPRRRRGRTEPRPQQCSFFREKCCQEREAGQDGVASNRGC